MLRGEYVFAIARVQRVANDRERQGRLALAPLARLVLDVPPAGRAAVGHQAVGDDATFSQVGLAAALQPLSRAP